jgi:hypothetical protein
MLRGIGVERRFFEWRLFADRRTGGTWAALVRPWLVGAAPARRFRLRGDRFPSAGANRDPPRLAVVSFFSLSQAVTVR